MLDAILQLERISLVYNPGLFRRPVQALDGLDLRVRRGEVYGLLGANGAGKTTAFRLLLGLLRPSAGGGTLLGRRLGDREALRRLGFLPELPSYYPHLSPRELLGLARALSGVPRDTRADAALLDSLGLEALADRPVRRMSKGQVQRLGLAQALVHDPELLILDEPMSGLDPIGRGLVKDRIRRERAAGRTILLASHVLADVEVLADRVGLLDQGKLVLEGDPRELLERAVLEVVVTVEGPLSTAVLQHLPSGSRVEAPEGAPVGAYQVRLARPEPAAVDACLRELISAGARVVGVETEREDLERLFLDRIGGAPAPDERRRA